MGKNLYASLAIRNIKNNKVINLPYILAIVVITSMHFLVVAMLHNEGLTDIPASGFMKICFSIGTIIIGIITFIFVVYINSFLIKKRLKEFGLYNILGLEKKHIIHIMFIENLIIFFGSVVSGLIFGTVFGKLCFLFLLKICRVTTESRFVLSSKPYVYTLLLFGLTFVVCFLMNVWSIIRNKTIDLLHNDKYGEKKVKGNIFIALAGLILLGIGYYKANTVENYVQAINTFFQSVLAVIIATYLLFISGSIVLLNILKKNKNFYYKTRNFISTSSLIYRLKQNAVGLANICILSTMAIVTAAGCSSLYTGQEKILAQLHPYDLTIEGQEEIFAKEAVETLAKRYNITIEDYIQFEGASGYFIKEDNRVERLSESNYLKAQNSLCDFVALSQEDYNEITKDNISLSEEEVVLVSTRDLSDFQNGFSVESKDYKVSSIKTDTPFTKNKYGEESEVIFIVFDTKEHALAFTKEVYTNPYDDTRLLTIQYINYEGKEDDRTLFGSEIYNMAEYKSLISNIDTDRLDAYGTYGGILFLGIFFIIVFLTITILIIYFKQVTEGYDDRDRFVILQKVGMDALMVKQAINRQIVIVFFMPLIMALIHLLAATNIIKAIMRAFYLVDARLIFTCVGATSAVFAVIYIVVYKMTAKIYYKIVKFESN